MAFKKKHKLTIQNKIILNIKQTLGYYRIYILKRKNTKTHFNFKT